MESIREQTGKRLCGDLSTLNEHLGSVRKIANRNHKVCIVCGKDCYHICHKCIGPDGKAGVAMHSATHFGEGGGIPCFFQHHNTAFFGLSRADCGLVGVKKRAWKEPNAADLRKNYRKVQRLMQQDGEDNVLAGFANRRSNNNNNSRDHLNNVNRRL